MTPPIRVLVVDDHAVVRDGITAMLDPHDDLVVVGEAADGEEAVRRAAELAPDLVLMDLRLPGTDGATATALINALSPPPRVLVLTTYDSDADILRAMTAGASGYLLKDTPRDALLAAIRAAAHGDAVLTPSVAATLTRQHDRPRPEPLSARERQVLTLVATGATNRDIAHRLHLAEATVKTYLGRIFTKLDVDDRTAAVTTALAQHLITLPPPAPQRPRDRPPEECLRPVDLLGRAYLPGVRSMVIKRRPTLARRSGRYARAHGSARRWWFCRRLVAD